MARKDTALRYFNENKAEFEKSVNEGIEKYRKNDALLIIESENGIPKELTVQIKQLNHSFRFGANIFMLDELETHEKNEMYREKFAKLFNLATIPFYWDTLEPEKGKPRYAKDSPKIYRRPAPDLCIEYCKENGIEPKCHCLNYDKFLPSWLENASVEETKIEMEKRFKDISERYSDIIPSFEVTNESLQEYHKSRFYEEDDFLEWSYKTADKYFKDNKLIINEGMIWWPYLFNNRNYYYMQIERLLQNKNIHLDSIGVQFHSFFKKEAEEKRAEKAYNPAVLRKILNCYAGFGLKQQITEMTIPAYSNDPEDEYVQAELMKNLYSIFFSHPNMEAIIYWNLVDGYAYVPENDPSADENAYFGGILRHDLSEKPAYKMLYHLIHEEWHTEFTQKLIGNKLNFRGFLGEYEAKITADGIEKTVCFKLGEGENIVKVKL